MSKIIVQRPWRIRAAVILAFATGVCTVAGYTAAPAAAAPPVGTEYCMDGKQTFSTWDAASQHVADKVVTQFGGTFTAGEVDPANIDRDAVRQFYDAIETSDAIGNYGVDTTIPNYIVHQISLGRCPFSDNHVFLCYSKFSDAPGVWPVGQAMDLIGGGYWVPTALDGTLDGGTNIGSYHLVCNPPVPDAKLALVRVPSTDLFVGGAGELVGSAAEGVPGYYPYVR